MLRGAATQQYVTPSIGSSVNAPRDLGGCVKRCERAARHDDDPCPCSAQAAGQVVVAVLHAMPRRADVLVDDPDHGRSGAELMAATSSRLLKAQA